MQTVKTNQRSKATIFTNSNEIKINWFTLINVKGALSPHPHAENSEALDISIAPEGGRGLLRT